MPAIPGFEVIGWNRPARQVGGDYYDFQSLGHGRWGLVVGDVTGKGMPAALLVSTLHSALRVLLDRMEVGPALIERLNRHIYESSSPNKFITMLLAALDSEGCRLAYLNAGHNPGLLIRCDGTVEQLPSAGLPLGLMPQGTYGVVTLDLACDDLVCIYSDGITECESPAEEELGLERLIALLAEHRKAPLAELIQRIDVAVTEFAQGQPQGDDQTVVLLRRCHGCEP
jgi:sigma-B regulation protein RsbU (phosphoserine phosphatase)